MFANACRVLAALALLVSGCGSAPAQPPKQPTKPEPQPMLPPACNTLQNATRCALDAAAARTGMPIEQIKVLRAEQVTWSDGSLGCPQPGLSYTQALVPGYRIRVQAGNEVLDYHASTRGQIVLCPAQRAVEPVPGGLTR